MRLRNEIKRPARFEEDPTIYQAPKRAAQSYRPKAARPQTYVDFNPNLPPAAFPTLDRVRPEQPNASKQFLDFPHGGYSTDLKSLYHITATAAQTASEQHCRTGSRCLLYPDCAQDPMIGFDPSSQYNNGPPNPTFVQNWTLAGRLAQRTEEEWFEQEMLTSEEEDSDHPMSDSRVDSPHSPSPEASHNQTELLTPPSIQQKSRNLSSSRLAPVSWHDLTLAVQLLIFNFLSRRNPPATVRAKLGLSKSTYAEIVRERTLQQRREEMEDKCIKEVIDEQRKLLLRDPKLDQSIFSDIFNKHLASPIKLAIKTNYDINTMEEIETGRLFLQKRNLDVEILGQWGIRPHIQPTEPQAHKLNEESFINSEQTSPDQDTTMTLDSPTPYPRSTASPLPKRAKPTASHNTTPCPAPTAIMTDRAAPTAVMANTTPTTNATRATTPPPMAQKIGPITHAEYEYLRDMQKLGIDAREIGHLPSLTPVRAPTDDNNGEGGGEKGGGEKGQEKTKKKDARGIKQKLANLQKENRERKGVEMDVNLGWRGAGAGGRSG